MDISTVAALGVPAAIVAGSLLLGLLLRHTIMTRMAQAAAQTAWIADDLVVAALKGPIVLWCTMLGVYLATELSALSPSASAALRRLLLVLLVVSITWAVSRLAGDLIGPRTRSADDALQSPRLVTNLVRAMVMILGGLIIMQTLGIAITPLVTALGVTGLAVGLALQDTLANLFAGIHILLSRQVRRGDFIRLSEGQEGMVQDITWRYTTIQQMSNTTTTVPNSKLASAITSNFTLGGGEQAVIISASVPYDSDLGAVEAKALAVAQAVMREVPGAADGFEPVVRFYALEDTRVRFNTILAGRSREAQYLIRHEFIKRLRQALQDGRAP